MLLDILANKALWTSACAFFIAQVIKFASGFYSGRKNKLSQFFGTGGMPSSHSATVSALAASIGLKDGFASSEFAISAVFCAIVLYDATNIRQAAGNNAHAINTINDQLKLETQEKPVHLDTQLGHTNMEVAVGFLLGIALSLFVYWFFV